MRDGTETRERIERAALTLFVRRGIAETSIRQIAKAAKVSLGAMYVHFKSKDELAEELFAEHFHRIGGELERLAEGAGPFSRRLAALIGEVFACVERDPASVAYLIRTRQEYMGRVRAGAGNPYLAFRKLIAGAIAKGEIPKQDPTLATAMVVGAVNQVIETHAAGHLRGRLPDVAAAVSAAALRQLGA
jgi:AcrR family transcriptional regulator